MRLPYFLLFATLLFVVGCSDSKPIAQAPVDPAPVEPKSPPPQPAAISDAPLESPYSKANQQTLSDIPALPNAEEMPKSPAQPATPATETPATPASPAPAETASTTAAAANKSPAWAKDLAPFLDNTTVAVVRVDWPNPDLMAITAEMKANGVDVSFLDEPMIAAAIASPEFTKGVSEIVFLMHYLEFKSEDGTVSLEKGTTPILHTTGAVPDAELAKIFLGDLAALLPPELLKASLPRHGEWVAVATQVENAKRLKNLQPANTAKLEAAAAAIEPAPIQAIALLNDDSRVLLIEQKDIPGGQIAKYYLDKINYGSASVTYAAGAKLNLIVDTQSKEDAQELYDWIDLTTQPGTAPKEIPAPLLALVREHLLPQMNDNQLSLALNSEQIAGIRAMVQPAIDAAREAAENNNP